MSDISEGRRSGDTRLEKIEANQEKMQDDIKELKSNNKELLEDVIYIKTRIDNGFSTSIKSTENKVDYIDKQNDRQHKELGDGIKDLSKKFDKMLWFLMASSIGISTGVILAIVKDWI